MESQQLKNKIQGLYGIVPALYFFVNMMGRSFMPLWLWGLVLVVLAALMLPMGLYLYRIKPKEQKKYDWMAFLLLIAMLLIGLLLFRPVVE